MEKSYGVYGSFPIVSVIKISWNSSKKLWRTLPVLLCCWHYSRQLTVVGSFHKEIWPCSSAQEAFTSRFTDLSRSAQNKLSALRFRGASPGPGCRISTIFRTWGFLQIDSEWTSSRCAVATGNWIRGRGAASPSPILIATGLWSFTAYSFLSSWFIARFSVYFHVPGFWMLFCTGYRFTCLTWSLNAMVSRVRQQGSYFRSFITSISKVEKSVAIALNKDSIYKYNSQNPLNDW